MQRTVASPSASLKTWLARFPRSGELFVTFAGDFGGPPEAYAG
jgi:hypothetical protein